MAYLTLDPGVPVGGSKGAAVHIEAVTAELAAAGHEVTVLAHRVAENGQATCPVIALDLDPEIRRGIKRAMELMARRAPENRLDRDLRALAVNANLKERIAALLTDLGVDVLLERLSLYGVAGIEAARAAHIPHVLEMNAPLAAEAARYRGLGAEPLARELEEQVLRETDCVLAVSRELEVHCLAIGVPAERIAVIPNGVDLERFSPAIDRGPVRRRLGWTNQELVIGFAGGLRPWHGGLDLVRAFLPACASNPDLRLLLVGDGPEREPMESLLAAYGREHMAHFAGLVPHAEVPSYLAAMDIAVAPYRFSEGFYFSPLKLYEYMAAGKCVVAADAGQIREVIAHGVNGCLVPAGDPAPLSDTITGLASDAGLRRRLGMAARQAAEEGYSWQRVAARIAERLTQLVDGVRSSACWA